MRFKQNAPYKKMTAKKKTRQKTETTTAKKAALFLRVYVYAFLSTINVTRKIIFLFHLPYTSYFTYIT